jgi:hypothetical protein
MKFQATAKVLRAHLFEGFNCFLKLRSYYRFLATEHQIKFSHAFTWGQILNPYLPNYMIAFAFFILLYLHGIVPPSPEAYPVLGTIQAYHVSF